MPQVILTVTNAYNSATYLKALGEAIPGIIVQHLGVPKTVAALDVADVELEVAEAKPLALWNIKIPAPEVDFRIVVVAHDYTERRDGIDGRIARIEAALREFIPAHASAYVWVQLVKGGYIGIIGSGQQRLL